MKEVLITRLSAGSVFKLVGVGLLCSLLPFTILMGCTAYFGFNTLSWNNAPLKGVSGLIASPFIGMFMVAIFTMFLGSAVVFGLWVYSLIGPIEISYKEVPKPQELGNSLEPNPACDTH